MPTELGTEASKAGMKIHISNAKLIINGEKNNYDIIEINGEPVNNVENYVHLVKKIGCDGYQRNKTTQRIALAWNFWEADRDMNRAIGKYNNNKSSI